MTHNSDKQEPTAEPRGTYTPFYLLGAVVVAVGAGVLWLSLTDGPEPGDRAQRAGSSVEIVLADAASAAMAPATPFAPEPLLEGERPDAGEAGLARAPADVGAEGMHEAPPMSAPGTAAVPSGDGSAPLADEVVASASAPGRTDGSTPIDDDPRLPWRAFAAAVPDTQDRPLIAIVIDDLGHSPASVQRAVALDRAVTLAFLPYMEGVERNVWLARRAGHEVLVHLPMEPLGDEDPGPQALATALDRDELLRRLYWSLSRFDQFVGINNHMGSKFSADPEAMRLVLDELKRRGLLYLDSATTPASVAPALAAEIGVPFARRDLFLDNDLETGAIGARLAELEQVARRQGQAVAIAHPHRESLEALEAWLPTLAGQGLALVPLSEIVRRNGKGASTAAAAPAAEP